MRLHRTNITMQLRQLPFMVMLRLMEMMLVPLPPLFSLQFPRHRQVALRTSPPLTPLPPLPPQSVRHRDQHRLVRSCVCSTVSL